MLHAHGGNEKQSLELRALPALEALRASFRGALRLGPGMERAPLRRLHAHFLTETLEGLTPAQARGLTDVVVGECAGTALCRALGAKGDARRLRRAELHTFLPAQLRQGEYDQLTVAGALRLPWLAVPHATSRAEPVR